MEFLGYARQVVQQMELLESRYIDKKPAKQRFCVSTQHYTFTTNAFVELIQHFGQERFEFILNETQTHQIVEDVRNRLSDLGILYLCNSNENVLRKLFEEYSLNFFELFTATPHIFIAKNHPLAKCASVRLEDLKPYPRLSFVQGTYESSNYSEELFSNEPAERSIKVSDRAAIVNLMIGLDGYTISKGFLLQFVNVKIYLFGITALTGYVTEYSAALWVLLLFEMIIATIGTIATLTWIGMGVLIQRAYQKYYRLINIILALTLSECVYSMLK